ncbi:MULTISPECIES: DeoR/GlpR family DNA-binding transcription regulator [unclassified Mesorhizobium]|uniref:DeoR/GlpR family DNA-binding transcription regulator n=1 Tax=unclassified Mesorhizobium TaxID=325217 RepID=UPI00112CFAF2|nr:MULTISPECIES: DeoR/GlpR family DNA-binding transcription regulator [unclassified Mesorhizobium]TPJ41348.1 DeoR/GlpR transcriptional regulator [Mesorhizobium sp. B2-6-6]MCA0002367.1 DeoR/GlpR family DNA-binding transcription regulator [Mesorhizobium sp. B264B2A]MCA0008277.1 DeoR/GlpR family DNA-binding transcription regulator [Mesorhizobium sp. B264B1B]MCA0021653.1 DeoR/GlpR family DNA-binding transcription regulator [Mesorhizobium sp. B264B1A]TPK61946.1 DeoR/GlpR transcriptional regulator [
MSPDSRLPARALAPRRHDEILRRLGAQGSVSVAELAGFFDVSRETIRRDLKLLSDQGRLGIVHGGAARFEPSEPAMGLRSRENAPGKAAIGRAAAGLVSSGMVVFLDSGTTTLAVAQAMNDLRDLTICTASLKIALHLCHVPGMRVHILGGEVDPGEEAASGIDALDAMARFRVDIAFLGGGALSPDGEVTDFTRAGAEQRGRMIALAGKTYFVLDSSKFGKLTPLRIPNFDRTAGVIVDARPQPALADALLQKGPELIIAS